MKQFIILLMCAALFLSCVGCRGQKTDTAAEQTQQSTDGDAASEPGATLAPSVNKEVVTEETAPVVYWAMDEAYHLAGCESLQNKTEGEDYTEIPWSMVEQIGLRQCPACNPPQYRNYVENDD